MIRVAVCVLLLAPSALAADGLDLSPGARAAFRAELRALLLEEPEILQRALAAQPPAPDITTAEIYADAAASDRARIAALAEPLFALTGFGFGADSPAEILTVFVSADCPDCLTALTELLTLTQTRPDLRVELRALDTTTATAGLMARLAAEGPARLIAGADLTPGPPARTDVNYGADLATALELDIAPSYVLPDMLLRGWMPAQILPRYLAPR
ncbi:hypothetical protein [Pseudooceanicola sp.]|uniref:hypothetical protein n=1 Tax=Pseudooceanicola sp. TaxID=1914328 RepID=UPI0026288561|nr:hypothetical protein [Pseudooceanicola sp.]MDF1854023.1 hypothetical protein [Pseudooceanicola sp.]